MALVIDPLTSVTLGQAVGNIMSALVDAQAEAARTTVEFIDQVGFLPPTAPGAAPALRTVEFVYRKLDENSQEAAFQVSLPLLGMVDIPLIAIRRATIDLEFEMTSVEAAPQQSGSKPILPGLRRQVFKGRVLSGRRTTDERASIKISVELEKADLPPGLARSLDILEVAAKERIAPEIKAPK